MIREWFHLADCNRGVFQSRVSYSCVRRDSAFKVSMASLLSILYEKRYGSKLTQNSPRSPAAQLRKSRPDRKKRESLVIPNGSARPSESATNMINENISDTWGSSFNSERALRRCCLCPEALPVVKGLSSQKFQTTLSFFSLKHSHDYGQFSATTELQ